MDFNSISTTRALLLAEDHGCPEVTEEVDEQDLDEDIGILADLEIVGEEFSCELPPCPTIALTCPGREVSEDR